MTTTKENIQIAAIGYYYLNQGTGKKLCNKQQKKPRQYD
jgi:hypothetical protein